MTYAPRAFSALALSALALSACAYPITAADAFKPQAGTRLGTDSVLQMRDESTLGDATVTHRRIGTPAGPIALTLVDTPQSERLIVVCMGNIADRVKNGADYADDLMAYGDVLLWDYPGYGQSGGKPEIADFEQAIPALIAEVDAMNRPAVIAWGHSLGGFVCAQMVGAGDDSFDAMVFEASARNAEEVAKSWMPAIAKPFLRIQVRDGLEGYDSADALDQFNGRIAILAAGQDSVLEPALSQSLADALRATGHDIAYFEFAEAEHDSITSAPEFDAFTRDVVFAGLPE